MRPVPIPHDQVLAGTQRIVVGPPGNDLNSSIAPVEACVGVAPNGVRTISVRCELEDGDLERLARGSAVWLTFMENIVPFDIQVEW